MKSDTIPSNPNIKDVLNEKNSNKRNEIYNKYDDNITPKHNIIKNIIYAFIFGGSICVIGQLFTDFYIYLGSDVETSTLYSTLSLILLSALLTGFGLYSKIAKYGGAGTLVPITGFANSVVAPAIEYKKEGQVFGIGCKIFTIAGPVILYGIFSSWLLGLIYWLIKLL